MKIYRRDTTGMLALVDPETGSGRWVDSGNLILSKVDVADGWTEQKVVPVDEPEVVEVRTWGGDVVIEIVLSSDNDAPTTLRYFQEYEDIGPGDSGQGYIVERVQARDA